MGGHHVGPDPQRQTINLVVAVSTSRTSRPAEFPGPLAVFFGIGVVIAVVNQPIIVLVQTHVPGEMLGRAITVMGSLVAAAQPVAAILSGTLADLSSIGLVFVVSGLAMAGSTAIMFFAFPDLAVARY